MNIIDAMLDGLRAMSAWEVLGVGLAIAYLVLAIRQQIACWAAAILSASIYLYLAFDAALYMQSFLQLFYIAMAVYGWRVWRGGSANHGNVPVRSLSLSDHALPLLVIIVGGAALGLVQWAWTDAVYPFIDAWVAVAAMVATWMVAQKILQNWHYWFVIDTASAFLYFNQGLVLTAFLFVVYLVLIVVGYRQWRGSMVDVND